MFKRKTSFLVSMLDFGGVNGVESFQSILVQLIKKDSVFLVHRMAADHSPIIYHKNSDTVRNRYSNLVGVFFPPTHLKNILIKLDHETPRMGEKIRNA